MRVPSRDGPVLRGRGAPLRYLFTDREAGSEKACPCFVPIPRLSPRPSTAGGTGAAGKLRQVPPSRTTDLHGMTLPRRTGPTIITASTAAEKTASTPWGRSSTDRRRHQGRRNRPWARNSAASAISTNPASSKQALTSVPAAGASRDHTRLSRPAST